MPITQKNSASEEPDKRFFLRHAEPEDGEAIARIEQICFRPETALSPKTMKKRAAAIPEMFLMAVRKPDSFPEPDRLPEPDSLHEPDCLPEPDHRGGAGGEIAGFLTALATDEERFRDAFFEDPSLHDPDGRNIMLLGLEVLPGFRHRGIAAALMNHAVNDARKSGRRKLVLTCEDDKIPMYEKFGFRLLGVSGSVLGGVTWYEMELCL